MGDGVKRGVFVGNGIMPGRIPDTVGTCIGVVIDAGVDGVDIGRICCTIGIELELNVPKPEKLFAIAAATAAVGSSSEDSSSSSSLSDVVVSDEDDEDESSLSLSSESDELSSLSSSELRSDAFATVVSGST